MVQDDAKLLVDSGDVPKLNGLVGGSNPGRETVFLLDGKLAKWSSALCVSKKKKEKEEAFIGLPIRINGKQSQTPTICKFNCHTFQACTCMIMVYNVGFWVYAPQL